RTDMACFAELRAGKRNGCHSLLRGLFQLGLHGMLPTVVNFKLSTATSEIQGMFRRLRSDPCMHKLSASERGVYAASLSLLPQLSMFSKLIGSFPLKRPKGRAPTN